MLKTPPQQLALLLLMGCCLAALLPAQTVILDNRTAGVVDQGIVVPDLSPPVAREQARLFRSRMPAGTVFGRLLMARSRDELLANYGHGTRYYEGNRIASYEDSISEIKRLGMPLGPVAQLIVVKGRAKFSYFERGKLSEEQEGSSTDPTIFHQGSYSYELVHFGLRLPRQKSLPPFLNLYFKASPVVSAQSCAALCRALQNILASFELIIDVRGDAWFLSTSSYPLVPVFTKPLEVPNSVRFLTTPTVDCGNVTGSGLRCSGSNFAP